MSRLWRRTEDGKGKIGQCSVGPETAILIEGWSCIGQVIRCLTLVRCYCCCYLHFWVGWCLSRVSKNTIRIFNWQFTVAKYLYKSKSNRYPGIKSHSHNYYLIVIWSSICCRKLFKSICILSRNREWSQLAPNNQLVAEAMRALLFIFQWVVQILIIITMTMSWSKESAWGWYIWCGIGSGTTTNTQDLRATSSRCWTTRWNSLSLLYNV